MDNERFAFFLDIDGTLYTDGTVCEKNRLAIARARQLGHLVFINTARSAAIIPPQVAQLPVDGFITSLGCSINIRGRQLLCEVIPPAELARLVDYFESQNRQFIFEGEHRIISNRPYAFEGTVFVNSSAEYLDKIGDDEVSKVYIPGTLTPEEQRAFGEKYVFFQHESYAEFAVKGHSKSTGIAAVLREYDIPVERSAAMGDSLNDADMLAFCGISVAMGDAVPEVAASSDIVTCPAAEGGVAEGIMKITGIEII